MMILQNILVKLILYLTSGPNIAFGKTATQGPGDFSIGMVAGNAVNNVTYDNNQGTCAQTTLGTTNDPAWWQVDLGDTYLITGIKIYNRQKHGKRTQKNTTLLSFASFVLGEPACSELNIDVIS